MRDLPDFSELRELGAGAQGRVVLATHLPSGRVAAVKYLHGADAGAVARFRDEAVLLHQVKSRHVAALYEFRETEDGAAIVMEAVEGTSLRALLDRHRTLTPEAALTVLKGSLLGLQAAHRLGIVHRDYKPANVMVTGEGLSKLIDFGVAVFAGSRGGSGTPSYMAPEQWERTVATPATDVYAATCVFFECVTGHRPFRDGSLADLHRLAPIPVEEVPKPLRGLVSRGMAKDPADRPPSAQSFVAELEAAASAGYGADWEVRGGAVLGGMAAGLLGGIALTAMSGGGAATTAAATAGTGLGSGAAGAGLMSGALLTVVSAALGVAVTAGVGVFAVKKLRAESPASPPAAAAPAPSLAYVTPDAVEIATASGQTRTLMTLPARTTVSWIGWSADGERLGWMAGPDESAGAGGTKKLYLAPVKGGTTRSWTCPDYTCASPVFRGDQLITGIRARSGPPALLLYPDDGGSPRRVTITGLPRDTFLDNDFTTPTLQAATKDAVIVSYGVGTSAYGGPASFYRIAGDGRATKIFDDGGNVAPHSGRLSPDGRALVYTGAGRGGYCDHHEFVAVADLASGKVSTPRMPADYVTVSAAWYDASGALNGAFLKNPASCANPNAQDVPVSPDLFTLRSGAWTPTGRTALAAEVAADGAVATLTGTSPPGTLTITRKGETTTLDKVAAFTWAPK